MKCLTRTLVIACVLVLPLSPIYGQIVNPSVLDLWDVSEGTEVTANSPLHPSGFDARDMFGRESESLEPGVGTRRESSF